MGHRYPWGTCVDLFNEVWKFGPVATLPIVVSARAWRHALHHQLQRHRLGPGKHMKNELTETKRRALCYRRERAPQTLVDTIHNSRNTPARLPRSSNKNGPPGESGPFTRRRNHRLRGYKGAGCDLYPRPNWRCVPSLSASDRERIGHRADV